MAQEKQYTAKQAAAAVLDKVGEILKKSALVKTDALAKSEIGKAAGRSDGHYSNVAAPEEPRAGKASKPGKCPECGHPSEATGQGDTLPRTKAQENWMEKGETKHDRCVEHVKENSPDVSNPHAVCVAEGVKPSKWNKSELEKGETMNSKKMGYKLSEAGKETREPEKSDHAFEVEGEKSKKSSDDPRLSQQKDPQHNAKEQAEGNNELAGTTPTQVGQDGKNKPGYDEMKGHLKLAKFIGMKHYKRGKSLEGSQSQSGAEAQHKESIKNK